MQKQRTDQGLEGGLDSLLAAQGERVYRFCLRLCGGRAAEAEDLAQDVFVLAWQNRESFAGRSALTTWLMRIALNRHLRLRQKTEAVPSGPDVAPDEERIAGPTVDDPARQVLDRMELMRALDLLPARQRAAFLLVKMEGLKYREAAETLGVPQGTVQSDVHAATLRLRTALLASEAVGSPVVSPAAPRPASVTEVFSHVAL